MQTSGLQHGSFGLFEKDTDLLLVLLLLFEVLSGLYEGRGRPRRLSPLAAIREQNRGCDDVQPLYMTQCIESPLLRRILLRSVTFVLKTLYHHTCCSSPFGQHHEW